MENLRKASSEINKYDLHFELEGYRPCMKVVSEKAFQEMAELVPSKIDRMTDIYGFGKIFKEGFGSRKSTKHEMSRKKIFVGALNLNSSSKFIPSMVKCLSTHIRDWKIGEEYEIMHQLNLLTFKIFTFVLFGEDMEDISTNKITFENPLGQKLEIELRESFINIVKDHFDEYFNPITNTVPILSSASLINPFKRNKENLRKHPKNI